MRGIVLLWVVFCCLLLPPAVMAAEQCLVESDRGGPEAVGKPTAVPPGFLRSGSTARSTETDAWLGPPLLAKPWASKYGLLVSGGALALALLVAAGWHRQQCRASAREQALIEQLEALRALVDGLPHPVYLCDRQGRLIDCNRSFLQAEAISEGPVSGRPLGQVAAAAWRQAREQVLATGQGWAREYDTVLADGRACRLSHWMRLAPCKRWIAAGWIDVTESYRRGLRGTQASERLLDNLCQEARGSLDSVLGMLERAMPRLAPGAFEQQSVDQALRAARELSNQLACVHDALLLQTGERSLSLQPIALHEHFCTLFEACEQRWRNKGRQLSLDYQGPSRAMAQLDPMRVQQLLSCVLAHVFRCTRQGCVRLTLNVVAAGTSMRMRLRIESPAAGMGEDDLALSIGRALCRSMGGQLRAGRRRINIRLCLSAVQSAVAHSPEQVTSPRLRVLVVDDHPANRLLLCLQLRRLGHVVDAVEDGGQAIRARIGSAFDVVISDCGMPVMDGHALARAIRLYESRRQLRPCLLIGVTGRSVAFGLERCLAAGMDQCLLKPMTLAQLRETLLWHEHGPDTRHGGAIDLAELERLTAGNVQALAGLLQDLLRANRDDLRRLGEHARRHDAGSLANLAHRIKGGVRIIKAWDLVEACERVEHCCAQASADRREVGARLRILIREVLWLEVRLRRYQAHRLQGNSA
ncbi:response regulator [Pseudomonas mosselii]|uniref:histidine kinase n=1 Tax=Pseudomonas mosselii TaxID=78327 RepID=A0AA42ULI3_9PSED|nr:response regulator [Pseudomonas mosselii]MDH1630627.1 response regulator [Pseudomonas mosselii]